MKTTNSKFLQMGYAALVPGMQYMLERMQAELDDMRVQLATLQNGDVPSVRIAKQQFSNFETRGKDGKHSSAGVAGFWAKMSPEERSAEMNRRMKMRYQNRAADNGLRPQHKDHPDHAAWVAKQRKHLKKQWTSKTPAQKKKWIRAVNAGKEAKRLERAREARQLTAGAQAQ